MRQYADPGLEDTLELPHTGIPSTRAPRAQPQPVAPPAKARPQAAHLRDPEYWIKAVLWRPLEVARIAKCTRIAKAEVERHLVTMQARGEVEEHDGAWSKAV